MALVQKFLAIACLAVFMAAGPLCPCTIAAASATPMVMTAPDRTSGTHTDCDTHQENQQSHDNCCEQGALATMPQTAAASYMTGPNGTELDDLLLAPHRQSGDGTGATGSHERPPPPPMTVAHVTPITLHTLSQT